MAQLKIDDREMKDARAAIERDGQERVGARFGEDSPECRAAISQRQRTKAAVFG